MKKLLCLLVTTVLFISCITPVIASDDIKVRLGGELINFDVPPQLINNRTMVPLRAIFEALGATVDWNGETQTVTSTKGDTTISLTINNPTMYVNGESVTLDSPACLVDGRTLVPVRAISEAFKLKVEWIDSTKTVKIKTKVSVPSQLSETDGLIIDYMYDDNGNLILISMNNGYWRKNTYDANENLILSTDANGSLENYTYDSNGNIVYYETNSGFWEKSTYNEKNQLILLETVGRIIESTYNEKGQLILEKFTDADGFQFQKKYTYNEYGLITFLDDSTGYWEKSTYDENGNILLFETAMALKNSYVYDENGKKLTELSSGYTGTTLTEYIYDDEGLLVTEITKENGNIISQVKYKTILK